MPLDLSGRLAIEIADGDAVGAYLRRQFAPFGEAPEVDGPVLRILPADHQIGAVIELQGPAEDGTHSGTDGRHPFVTWDRRRCTIPDVLAGESSFAYEPGFPMWRLLRAAVRPAAQIIPAIAGHAVAAHAASVTLDGRAIVVAGWAESGKTETALGLMERGASFLSDKWTYLGRDDLEASAFPISVGIRRWVLDYLPTLDAATTRRSRIQFLGARAAGLMLEPVSRRPGRSRGGALIPDLARRLSNLGDRAAYEMDELRAAYGQVDDPLRRVPIGSLVLLRTIAEDEVRVRGIEAAEAASRLARTAAYERRSYLDLLERLGYLDARAGGAVARAVEADQAVLRDVCARVPLLVVECPFPVDPGRVADAILRAA